MNDLTDREKSALLAKAMRWEYETIISTHTPNGVLWIYPTNSKPINDLYAPANMHLALRVIQWGYKHDQAAGGFYDWLNQPVELWRSGAIATLIRENGIREALDVLVTRLIEVKEGG